MTPKCELARMTYKEAREAFSRNPIILIPMGSTEQHGPQCPVGDYRIAEALSVRIAERTGSISAPVIPYSEGAAKRNFPGAVSIRAETLYSLVWDVCQAFLRFDLDHLLLVCGDHGNMPILEKLIRDVKDECGVRVGMVEQFQWPSARLLQTLYKTDTPEIAHGGDFITSVNLHLFPEDVRLDLREESQRLEFQGLKVKSFTQLVCNDNLLYLPIDYDEFSPNGVLGSASMASQEIGKALMEEFVKIGVGIVERFRKLDTRCSPDRLHASAPGERA